MKSHWWAITKQRPDGERSCEVVIQSDYSMPRLGASALQVAEDVAREHPEFSGMWACAGGVDPNDVSEVMI